MANSTAAVKVVINQSMLRALAVIGGLLRIMVHLVLFGRDDVG